MSNNIKPIIIGITGASGVIYGIRLLEKLFALNVETHLVMTDASKMTLRVETEHKLDYVTSIATHVHNYKNIGAIISSGSFITSGMIVAPCSMRTLSEIASGLSSNLLSRAADVTLKERRRLVLLTRETPLHAGHIRAMAHANENGAIIMPPVPAFYAKPTTLDDMINHTVMRCLDLFNIHSQDANRWEGLEAQKERAESL
jgi:4-hydroxy-3-polyprenylbenzoate decarboxylase